MEISSLNKEKKMEKLCDISIIIQTNLHFCYKQLGLGHIPES